MRTYVEPKQSLEQSSGFPTRSGTNRPVQSRKKVRILNLWAEVEEELYYPSNENKGADQLRNYSEADLRLCFRKGKTRFSHDATNIINYSARWGLNLLAVLS